MKPKLLTIPEASERARITPRTMWKWLRDETGPAVTRIGGRTFIQEHHFQDWLMSNVQRRGRSMAHN